MLEVVLMSNEDYREKIEEHRQLIEFEEQQNSRMSRSRRSVKKKKRKNPLMTILLFLLLGIPIMILVYVSFFYNPNEPEVAENKEDGTVVELQTNNIVSANSKEKDEAVIDSDVEAEDKEITEEEKTVQAETQTDAKDANKEQDNQQQQSEQEQQQEQQANGQVHTVQPNENLFRIALKYYNDASGVEKIKAANNLNSDSISVGQSLIIPN